MEAIFASVIEDLPNIAGFIILALILYRQNNQLMTALLERIDLLEHQVADLKSMVVSATSVKPLEWRSTE